MNQPTTPNTVEPIDIALEALKKISETRFGWDGDCGVVRYADDAIYAIETILADRAQRPTVAPSVTPTAPVMAEGLRIVPIEPTEAMYRVMLAYGTKRDEWRAILDVAHPVAGSPAEVLTEAQMAYVLQCRGMRNMAQRAYALGKAAAEPMPASEVQPVDTPEFEVLLQEWRLSYGRPDQKSTRAALIAYIEAQKGSK